jgi:hypothetical protein
MTVSRLLPTVAAAVYLGVTPETLRSWRRRGMGPAYCRFPGGHVRRGNRSWDEKRNGTILYPVEALETFVERLRVQEGRLPRPFPGRLPGAAKRKGDVSD